MMYFPNFQISEFSKSTFHKRGSAGQNLIFREIFGRFWYFHVKTYEQSIVVRWFFSAAIEMCKIFFQNKSISTFQ